MAENIREEVQVSERQRLPALLAAVILGAAVLAILGIPHADSLYRRRDLA